MIDRPIAVRIFEHPLLAVLPEPGSPWAPDSALIGHTKFERCWPASGRTDLSFFQSWPGGLGHADFDDLCLVALLLARLFVPGYAVADS